MLSPFTINRLFSPSSYIGRTRQEVLDDLSFLKSVFFYSFPNETKPPIVFDMVLSEKTADRGINPEKITISMALAGFKEEDIRVYVENNTLYIEGSNIDRDIPDRFKGTFKRDFPVKDHVDLDKANVSLVDGLLLISIPLKDPIENRSYLLGEPSKE